MKIALYGATGAVGPRIVAEAVSRGHAVTAFARKGGQTTQGVPVTVGDATEIDAVRQVASEHDVVVSALGPSREPGGDPHAFVGVVRGLARAVGDTRLAIVGGAGSLLVAPGVRLVDTPTFPDLYKPEALAQAAALDELRQADASVDWFYLSPAPALVPGERSGKYNESVDDVIGMEISYEDYAVALVDELESAKHHRQRFAVEKVG